MKLDQTITFTALSDEPLSASPITVSASATSGLPVTFTTTTPSVCSQGGTNGATITLIGAGTCTVQADQAGDSTYNPAPTVVQSFTVSLPHATGGFVLDEFGGLHPFGLHGHPAPAVPHGLPYWKGHDMAQGLAFTT